MKLLSAIKLGIALALTAGIPIGLTASYPVHVFAAANGWQTENGISYWYEDGVKQGTEGRGKEIFDPGSNAWYWLDSVDGGRMAVSKDVYQESSGGKWVRYDENGHMIKGWQTTSAGTYYFDLQTGAMAKGNVTIDGKNHNFDINTGIQTSTAGSQNGWSSENDRDYWYENGVRQGYDPNNPSYRGKEIYDPGTNAWYWLDNVEQGAKAVSKDVYQESNGGKWVRYDANGHMIKGWNTQNSEDYYFDLITGAMLKGYQVIDGTGFYFDDVTGIYTGMDGFQQGDLNIGFEKAHLDYSYYSLSNKLYSTIAITDWSPSVTYNQSKNRYSVSIDVTYKVKYIDGSTARMQWNLIKNGKVITQNDIIITNPKEGQEYTQTIIFSSMPADDYILTFTDYIGGY